MDLGLLKRNIDAGLYSSIHDAVNDVRLIWSNCLKYNEYGSEFSKISKRLSKIFEEKFRSLLQDMKLDVQTVKARQTYNFWERLTKKDKG
jgi:hypothetical protein